MLKFLASGFIDDSALVVVWVRQHVVVVTVTTMILLCIILAFMASMRPIHALQYRAIVNIALQAESPRSQRMALYLLQQPQIRRAAYFKLSHAYHSERAAQKSYPALEIVQPSSGGVSAQTDPKFGVEF